MSDVIVPYQPGYNLYIMIRRKSDLKVWWVSGQAFETYGSSSHDAADYAIAMTGDAGGLYSADFDSNIEAGRYLVTVHLRMGDTPADTDLPISTEPIQIIWSGAQAVAVEYEVTHANLTDTIIEARVRAITLRTSTTELTAATIYGYIQEICREISKRAYNLKNSATGTLAADTNTITIPDDMIPEQGAIDELYLDTTLLDPITFDEWRSGYRSGYAYRDGVIYVSPTPDTGKSYTLYYRRYHQDSVTTIEHNDDFKMCIVYGVCQRVYEQYEQAEEAVVCMQKFENELSKNMPAELGFVKMRQMRE